MESWLLFRGSRPFFLPLHVAGILKGPLFPGRFVVLCWCGNASYMRNNFFVLYKRTVWNTAENYFEFREQKVKIKAKLFSNKFFVEIKYVLYVIVSVS